MAFSGSLSSLSSWSSAHRRILSQVWKNAPSSSTMYRRNRAAATFLRFSIRIELFAVAVEVNECLDNAVLDTRAIVLRWWSQDTDHERRKVILATACIKERQCVGEFVNRRGRNLIPMQIRIQCSCCCQLFISW